MTYAVDILVLAFGITCTLLFLSMAAGGIRHGKVYYEPNCPPIPFRERPVAFLALCLLYVAFCVGALWVVFWAGRRLLELQ